MKKERRRSKRRRRRRRRRKKKKKKRKKRKRKSWIGMREVVGGNLTLERVNVDGKIQRMC
jgi:hypothetical protein